MFGEEDVLGFKQKGRVVLLGDFNARVGRSTDVDDVIGMFGEETCNASGNKFISFHVMETKDEYIHTSTDLCVANIFYSILLHTLSKASTRTNPEMNLLGNPLTRFQKNFWELS